MCYEQRNRIGTQYMENFLAELKRRHIYRVGAGYVVVAWILAQGVDLLSQVFEIPHSIAQPAILILAAGLPVALIVAWVAESKPQEAIGAAVRSKHTGVDWALFGVAVVLAGLTGYQQIARPSVAPAQSGVEAAREASATASTAISIAVLPFANLSGEASQEFFSDGMTEEITAALAKVPDLRVVARTSAYRFKGQNLDIQDIGQQLHATHLIEGSVRKAGARVRITVQLIKSDDGTHIWAENYDRDLIDVFAIQEDIARAIAASLRMPLGLKPGENLVQGTRNLGSYQEYLQARIWFRDRNSPQRGPFLQTLESVVARDPGFSPAWATLSRVYLFQTNLTPAVEEGPVEEARAIMRSNQDKAEMAAQKAIELEPRHAGGYVAKANIRLQQGRWAEGEDLLKQALALDPNDPEALNSYGFALLMRTGRPKEALAVIEKLRTLEPLIPAYDSNAAMIMQVNGQNEAAIAILETIPANRRPVTGYVYLARAYAAAGRYAEGADTLVRTTTVFADAPGMDGSTGKGLRDAASVLRGAPAIHADPNSLPEFGGLRGELFFVYASVGAFGRAMDHPDREAQIHFLTDFGKSIWSPIMAPARKTERFKAFARNAGLVEYWRARGWPEFCHPTTGDDFACE
jgi:adenylate cyclase